MQPTKRFPYDGHDSDTDQGYETDYERKPKAFKEYSYTSPTLPFGQPISLSSINGPTYVTAQTLVQQAAYVLSEQVFSFSPDTFDLDLSLKQWHGKQDKNAFGKAPAFLPMDLRLGAGQAAVGYNLSKTQYFGKSKIPHAIVASSAALKLLRPSLEQLIASYNVATPVVAHVSAADYDATSSTGMITDYVTAMTQADDLGLGLISSTSTYEAHHMSLFTTLLASITPSLHTYDGVQVGRETTRVFDAMSRTGLKSAYSNLARQLATISAQRMTNERKAAWLLDVFNEEMGTDYRPFEYYGHSQAESVLVVFGSVEGSLAAQLAYAMSNNGAKIGAINVRMYRPFAEESFIDAIPQSVKHIAVLGQVETPAQCKDKAVHSRLFESVLSAVQFSESLTCAPYVTDVKYPCQEVLTPSKMVALLQDTQEGKSSPKPEIKRSEEFPYLDILGTSARQYTFWDLDDSSFIHAPSAIANMLSDHPSENVAVRSSFDNLTEGGVFRSDIRCSSNSIEAPYSITAANVAFVGDEKILNKFEIANNVRDQGRIILRLPGAKEQDSEKFSKRLPDAFKKAIVKKGILLSVVDPSASTIAKEDSKRDSLLSQLAFLRPTSRENTFSSLGKLASFNGNTDTLAVLANDLEDAMWDVSIPEDWTAIEVDEMQATSRSDITLNSFVPFEKVDREKPSFLKSWIAAAQGLAFKEALKTDSQALRPDLSVKTSLVHVKEHRRLTPLDYDRNVFHIEFDLGDSGVKYEIGEALGIHPENNEADVQEFMKWYGLNPLDIVEVASRENPAVLENRTVHQALLRHIDIFGRPPKRFYEALAEFADSPAEKKALLALAGPEGAVEFKRRAEVDTVTYADVLLEFSSAHPSFHDIVRIVDPIKRREYSIASSQKAQPNSVSLLIVTVNWVDPNGRDRFGQATRYLNDLAVGAPVTVSLKPSVMKLPQATTAPIIMAGLGTGLAPFRAFVQERAWQKQQGFEVGPIMLYLGSRHQREEYLYGEEWEAYLDAGLITHLGAAFSRDQPQKIYIQDRMRQSLDEIRQKYLVDGGSFYLCGPTWPVPDVTEVLQEAAEKDAREQGVKKFNSRRRIEELKDEGRYVLEVY